MTQENTDDEQNQIARIGRIPAVEADVIEEIVQYESSADYEWADGLILKNIDEETKRNITRLCYEKGRERASVSDYEAAQWCKDAGFKVEDAVIETAGPK